MTSPEPRPGDQTVYGTTQSEQAAIDRAPLPSETPRIPTLKESNDPANYNRISEPCLGCGKTKWAWRNLDAKTCSKCAAEEPPAPSTPLEPQTCANCGWDLSFSEKMAGPYCGNPECYRRGAVILPPLDLKLREGISLATPSSPEIRDDDLGRLRSSMASAGYDVKKMSGTPAELTEALESIITELDACSGDSYNPPSLNTGAIKDQLENIRALYNRQREEIERDRVVIARRGNAIRDLNAEIASLSSQLGTLKGVRDDLLSVIEAQNGKLERLKASLPTPAEARLCLHVLETGGHAVSITHPLVAKLQQIEGRP